ENLTQHTRIVSPRAYSLSLSPNLTSLKPQLSPHSVLIIGSLSSPSIEQSTFIQMRTVLKVVDNLVVKMMICIQLLKGKKVARLGDTIVVSVKEVIPNAKVKKGKIVKVVGLLLSVLPCIMVVVIELLSNLMTMLQCYGFYLGKRKSSAKTAA
ncbi:hypothetical protein CUMW_241110, partial [Citrus unshiu]